MKFYLSSYKLGNETEKLKSLIQQTSGKFAYIPNALDFVGVDPVRRKAQIEENIKDLASCGGLADVLDLQDYFEKSNELQEKLNDYGGLYVQGGNTFVLRQAFKLSGIDLILNKLRVRNDFLYIGYSAGVCVLTPDLKPYAITDDANNFPYDLLKETVWDGLNFLDFAFEPHYHSDHPESSSTDKEIEYCIENKILFKAYHDGEVMIIE
jgi:dipeptidase E